LGKAISNGKKKIGRGEKEERVIRMVKEAWKTECRRNF